VGISPDIEVEQSPADVINGKDPQLDKAIEVRCRNWQRTLLKNLFSSVPNKSKKID